MNRVLVVAVHPDDETLGCGGTLLKHKDNGDEIHWLIATSIKEKDGFSASLIRQRDREIHEVERLFNFDSVHKLGLSSARVDTYSMGDLIKKISSVVNIVKPNVVYLPFQGDVHSDHRHIFDAAYSCTKSFRYPFIKKVCMMETLSETEFATNFANNIFAPNVFVDISRYMDTKVKIINIYKDEVGEHPFPRSERNIRALATFRGATCGCDRAEGFVLLKEIM